MNTIRNVYNYLSGKSVKLQNIIEQQSLYFLDNIDLTNNRTEKAFYTHEIICITTDAYEFFMEVNSRYNYFYENITNLTNEIAKQFYKLIVMHHLIRFEGKTNNYIFNNEEQESLFFNIFEFSESEKELYFYFLDLYQKDISEFELDFSKKFIHKVFNIQNISLPILAFTCNFFYNSYQNMEKYYFDWVV